MDERGDWYSVLIDVVALAAMLIGSALWDAIRGRRKDQDDV